MIAEINWDNFKVKFSTDKEGSFERLCYLLFCKEFGKDTGIFRFKNHAGIETNPIEKDDQVIGWQAKFYSTRLSEHKQDFIDSIDTTKSRHPSVNRIIFYTNQGFGQGAKKNDPQYKTEIENHAKSKGVKIEWRTASYFESPFVCELNFSIAQHFFSLNKGILDSIAELNHYTESVLKTIHSEILFDAKKIKLDHSSIVASLNSVASGSSVVVLSGGAGVGKTAVIKDFYETINDTSPFFVFKATQFKNISYINQLFKNYGEITASDFINEHKDINSKGIVIDSAEKLSEIEDQDIFRTFLSDLLENGWSVIFTVRHNYLDDLRFQLKEVYNTGFVSLDIQDITPEELEKIADDYGFLLPHNDRLVALLMTPLYLNEYLKNYTEVDQNISYSSFRDIIWKKQIQDSAHQANNIHRRREECFLEIAKKRANDGNFFVKTDGCDQEALQKLEADEIIKHDGNAGGYFITHDVYEEWALDKLIEQAFIRTKDYQSFYQEIRNSLPIRRAFRNWLSDKLFVDDENAKRLIEFTIKDSKVDKHWNDEVLVSVLLSDYSNIFFDHFEQELLEEPEKEVSHEGSSKVVKTFTASYKYEEKLLHKILFLLRIACKTIDEDFLRLLGIKWAGAISLKTVYTTPKGSGWESTIAFINKHKEKLQFRYMSAVLPVIDDWNRSHKEGETSKNASHIALFYYEELTKNDDFYFSDRDNTKDQLIRTIINGSGEIKTELTQIVNGIDAQKDVNHRSRYYELVKMILSSITDSSEISKHLPAEVIKLANLFWFYTPPKDTYPYSDYRNDIEQYFDLKERHGYYPASAFQTPIFTLLQTAPQETVDFVLSFTNRSIEYFSKSELGNEAEEIDIIIDDSGTTVKQYIGHRIWNIYRGTQTAPPLLESIHMALEKWLLMISKTWDSKVVEKLCLYLIKNSRSASITAIVVSVVLAEPSKLFNVAKVLFRTKDLFFFDSSRMQLDMTFARSAYSMTHDPTGIFRDERLRTCEDKHRNHSLENQALNYQLFASEGEDEEITKKRQESIWKIFDEYYAKLPDKSKEMGSDKTWRLCLARMDRRKMKISTEKKDDQVLISLNPEIDPELKQYSEDAQTRSSWAMRYLPLQLWARNRFERNDDAKKYPQYESGHNLALSEAKDILTQLKDDKIKDDQFNLFYSSVPSYVCAVIFRDYFEKLNPEEAETCKNVILEYSSMPLRDGYRYQHGDGLDVAVNVLPLLLIRFPEDAIKVKEMLLFLFFDSYPIGMSQRVSDYAISAVLEYLWKESPDDANAIFYGFLSLKPKYDEISHSIREENRKNYVYDFSRIAVIERFKSEFADGIRNAASNKLTYNDISDVTKIDPDTLVNAFLLIPLRTDFEDHKKYLRDISPILVNTFKKEDKEGHLDYVLEQKFLNKFAYFVLSSKKEEIESYVQPFVNLIGEFRRTRVATEIFVEFILAEDFLNQYDEFWIVWQVFYPKIVELCSDEYRLRYAESVVHKYLLAIEWKKDAREWHSLKEREKAFFKKVSEDIGSNSTVLYAIAKLLNDIGSGFAFEGISWISNILRKTPDMVRKELAVNAVYYLENHVRSFFLRNRQKIKLDQRLKGEILIILNFLIEKGSVAAYLLREDIL